MNQSRFDHSIISTYDSLSDESPADENTLVLTKMNTPFGELLAGATEKGICLLEFTDTERLEFQIPRVEKSFLCKVMNGNSPHFALLSTQLTTYFQGGKNCFSDIPLDLKGTEFQMQAWQALRAIPYGETRSYQQQAQAIHRPKAVRAVASANRNNRISIIIPCHRVIGKNGKMAGYGGGIWRKEFLLKLEGGITTE